MPQEPGGKRLPALDCTLGAAAVLIAALGTPLPGAADRFSPQPVEVTASGVVLTFDDLERTRVDRLEYRGGLDLRARDERFGGLSGLEISADGRRLTAVGDRGIWFTARLGYDAAGHLAGIAETAIAPLLGVDGSPLPDKRTADAESLVRDGDGTWIVGFERFHRLRRYAGPGAAASVVTAPRDLPASPDNGGAEALARLADGRFLLLSERLERAPEIAAAWIGDPAAPRWQPLRYRLRPPFRPVGAATGPDGAVYVLERRFTLLGGIGSRIVRLAPAAFGARGPDPGTVLAGEVLADWSPPLVADNFEGIAVRRDARGETLIYVVSDDNFSPLQRTLLLLFALAE